MFLELELITDHDEMREENDHHYIERRRRFLRFNPQVGGQFHHAQKRVRFLFEINIGWV